MTMAMTLPAATAERLYRARFNEPVLKPPPASPASPAPRAHFQHLTQPDPWHHCRSRSCWRCCFNQWEEPRHQQLQHSDSQPPRLQHSAPQRPLLAASVPQDDRRSTSDPRGRPSSTSRSARDRRNSGRQPSSPGECASSSRCGPRSWQL